MTPGKGSARLLVVLGLWASLAFPASVGAQTPRPNSPPDLYREVQRQRAIHDLYELEMRRRQDQLRAIQQNDLIQFRDVLREEETLRRLRFELEQDRLRELQRQGR